MEAKLCTMQIFNVYVTEMKELVDYHSISSQKLSSLNYPPPLTIIGNVTYTFI